VTVASSYGRVWAGCSACGWAGFYGRRQLWQGVGWGLHGRVCGGCGLGRVLKNTGAANLGVGCGAVFWRSSGGVLGSRLRSVGGVWAVGRSSGGLLAGCGLGFAGAANLGLSSCFDGCGGFFNLRRC
jgi:hypothetical protein